MPHATTPPKSLRSPPLIDPRGSGSAADQKDYGGEAEDVPAGEKGPERVAAEQLDEQPAEQEEIDPACDPEAPSPQGARVASRLPRHRNRHQQYGCTESREHQLFGRGTAGPRGHVKLWKRLGGKKRDHPERQRAQQDRPHHRPASPGEAEQAQRQRGCRNPTEKRDEPEAEQADPPQGHDSRREPHGRAGSGTRRTEAPSGAPSRLKTAAATAAASRASRSRAKSRP